MSSVHLLLLRQLFLFICCLYLIPLLQQYRRKNLPKVSCQLSKIRSLKRAICSSCFRPATVARFHSTAICLPKLFRSQKAVFPTAFSHDPSSYRPDATICLSLQQKNQCALTPIERAGISCPGSPAPFFSAPVLPWLPTSELRMMKPCLPRPSTGHAQNSTRSILDALIFP